MLENDSKITFLRIILGKILRNLDLKTVEVVGYEYIVYNNSEAWLVATAIKAAQIRTIHTTNWRRVAKRDLSYQEINYSLFF